MSDPFLKASASILADDGATEDRLGPPGAPFAVARTGGRYVWGGRMSAKREQSRVVKCQHCGCHYDVAVSFDEHYKGACVVGAPEAAGRRKAP